jgi:hypothetical protein
MQGQDLITNSRMASMKTCLRKHYFAYELGVRRDRGSQPLRMGTALHRGLDAMAKGATFEAAATAACQDYDTVPAGVDAFDWAIERESCIRLLHGYAVNYPGLQVEVIASEKSFDIPLVNPETQAPMRLFRFAGQIDKIVRLPDGRLAVMEHKTTSDDLAPESDYWTRLRVDHQISLYLLAARALGYQVETVIYDVIRKPGIQPRQIPQLDAEGSKIVLDRDGTRVLLKNGKPRQSGDKDLGYELQSRTETAEEFGNRLTDELTGNPTRYFARREIARTEADIQEFSDEAWQQAQTLRNRQLVAQKLSEAGRDPAAAWFRTTTACLHPYRCEYCDTCFAGRDLRNDIPEGFVRVENVHSELEKHNDK